MSALPSPLADRADAATNLVLHFLDQAERYGDDPDGWRWGDAHYGRLSGLVAAPTTLATALAPWAGAAAAEALGGYPVVFGLLAGIAVVAAGLAVGSVPAGPGPVRSGSRPARAR